MAHFAQLNQENIVIQVIVVNNSVIVDGQGLENEAIGITFCKSLFGENTNWKQTSYNKNFRKNYASPGCIYDEEHDAFYSPQPFPSWVLNKETMTWDPPVPYPTNGNTYIWNENENKWLTFDDNYEVE